MPRLNREEVDVTSALKNILDNYPAGSATLREILQNTDDAGAETQTFILDKRKFEANSLVDPALRICQGPAIIATNDAYFLPKDWKAITTILNSSKTQDETSTGKYGLGFRSCYHVTDNPHILSNDNLLILDPHKRVKKLPGGFDLSTKFALSEDGVIERNEFSDHFAPFTAVFSPNDEVYKGTAIRLPLRSSEFKSKLKSTPTTVEDARKMFDDFIAKELPEAMLFLKHLMEIKLVEIAKDGKETVLATAKVENAQEVASHRSREHASQGSISHHLVKVKLQIGSDRPETRKWIVTNFVEQSDVAVGYMAERLNRFRNEVQEAMTDDKLLPHVGLALPLPQDGTNSLPDFHGRLFTLLPLPIITSFPLHINGVLALVSSRQNLRNAVDAEPKSREEFLVEWNRVIFSEFVPKAWASLLQHLVSTSMLDVFAAWPSLVATQDGDPGYWYTLPTRLLEEIATKAIWPLYGKRGRFSSLGGVLIAKEGDRVAPLNELQACNVPVVVVPERIFKVVEASKFSHVILSPQSAHPYLKSYKSDVANLDSDPKRVICDYLVSAGDIRLILDLPIIPRVQSKHTSIFSHGNTKYVVATRSEAEIFSTVDPNLLDEDSMAIATRQLLLNDPAQRVRRVSPEDVARYLESQVPTFGGANLSQITTGIETATFKWLIRFWGWLDGWRKLAELRKSTSWNTVQSLYALPLHLAGEKPALRLVERSAVRPGDMGPEVVAALTELDVPILDGKVSTGSAIQSLSKAHTDVVFILQSIPKSKTFGHLSQAIRQTLHGFFNKQLLTYLQPNAFGTSRPQSTLDTESLKVLRTLPIFPVLPPGQRASDSVTYDVAPEGAYFVDDSVQVVPSTRDAPFISYNRGTTLHSALGGQDVLDEIAVLRLVTNPDTWSQQDRVEGLLQALVDRLMARFAELGDSTRNTIKELPIVEVGGRVGRRSPSEVVDPASSLAGLYEPEDEVLPIGAFGKEGAGSYINQLRNYGMIRKTITQVIIKERIARIADQSRPMPARSEKALRLLRILNEHTQTSTAKIPPAIVKLLTEPAWLPAANGWHAAAESWDSRMRDTLLCDLALPRVPFTVSSNSLRNALGWNRVPFETLQSQLLKALEHESGTSDRTQANALNRIEAVLKELASETHAGRLPEQKIQLLAEGLGDVAWVPSSSNTLCVGRRCILEQVDLGTKYHSVSPSLLQAPGMQSLLAQMGIHKRPTPASLYSTLREISHELLPSHISLTAQRGLIRTSILLLEELSPTIQGKVEEFEKTLVPTESDQLAPAQEVLYNDMGGDPTSPSEGFQFAHPSLPLSLSNIIGLRRMSEEVFQAGSDGIQSFHIGEDLTVRIKGVLQDYDLDHSSNEWLANAEDAEATEVTFLIDEAEFDGRRVVPGSAGFQSGPALVMHNNGVFTDKDFEGLCTIGQGGKSGRLDTIGRFGLGALSFYHFTELPLILSGDRCLLLDPSKQYLPRDTGNTPRSAAIIPLSHCRTRFIDQLKPLDGLFGFNCRDDTYDGTIFRFPLRSSEQAEKSKLSSTHFSAVDITNVINRFHAYASQSLFFTNSLERITAQSRTENLEISTLWSVHSICTTSTQDDMDVTELTLRSKAPVGGKEMSEHWLVAKTIKPKDGFPLEFHPLFSHHRLPTPTFGLALNLSAGFNVSDSRLFATLPLPISTSLPVHVHATWILAQDRRSIRYDAPDAAGQRPLDTLYNEHILLHGIAPLYIKTLAYVLHQHPRVARNFWPGRTLDGPSRVVKTEVYKQLVSTNKRLLLSTQSQPLSPQEAVIHRPQKSPQAQAVQRVFRALQLPNFVPNPYFDTNFLEDWGSLRFDTTPEVSKILRENRTSLKDLWRTTGPSSHALTSKDILAVLEYLVKGLESLDGVPLILRGDRELVEFRTAKNQKVFASHRNELVKLFGASAVLSSDVSEPSAKELVQLNGNVVTLDAEGMRDLLRLHKNILPANVSTISSTESDWYDSLLEFLASSTCPVSLDDLPDLPLLPTVGRELLVSLNHARGGRMWRQSLYESSALTAVLLQLDVTVVKLVPGVRSTNEPLDISRILGLFGQLGLTPSQITNRIPLKEWAAFVQYLKPWIQRHFIERLSNAEYQTLLTLPLFEGRQGPTQVAFASANEVFMLPVTATLNSISRYLPSGLVFSTYSDELAAILGKNVNSKQRILSFPSLIDRLCIPGQLPEDEDLSFRPLLHLIINNHRGLYNKPIVPDENRILRRPNELFDHRIALYSTSYEGRLECFVHPRFRDMIDRFVDLGVQSDITSSTLLQCLQVVDSDARQGRISVLRALNLWNYVNEAPSQLRGIQFNIIRSLRFLPRQTQRHALTSDFDSFAQQLPDVVSLDQLCSPEREAVAWTQRARFTEDPSLHFKAVYPEVGQPTVFDVVRHLMCLSSTVAASHRGSPILYSDVQSIYKWLQDNKNRAKDDLLPFSRRPMWLNVDSHVDEWSWKSSDDLVFNIRYDTGGRSMVKSTLLPYRTLLLDVGAHEYRPATPQPENTLESNISHSDMVRQGWNGLRDSGQLLDVCFKIQEEKVWAHRGMMAAMVPHFQTAFGGSFRESIISSDDSDLHAYRLPDDEPFSVFSVQSVVDYVYTGQFTYPTFSKSDAAEANAALDDLLDLMELSNIWDIPKLTKQAVKAITDLELIRFDNCQYILEQARKCQIATLISLCERTIARNSAVVT